MHGRHCDPTTAAYCNCVSGDQYQQLVGTILTFNSLLGGLEPKTNILPVPLSSLSRSLFLPWLPALEPVPKCKLCVEVCVLDDIAEC